MARTSVSLGQRAPFLLPCVPSSQVCILSFICSNGAELFQLDEMVEWRCAFSNSRFNELQRILLTAREEGHSCHKWG
jgi:hypothetical protein